VWLIHARSRYAAMSFSRDKTVFLAEKQLHAKRPA
jgi:hypothetical protein